MNLFQKLQRRLGWKLFLSYLVVILVGVAILAATAEFVIPATFNRHMSGMMGTNDMMGMMGQMDTDLFPSFRAAFNEALFLATTAAVLAAGVVSFFVTRQVVAPVQAMTRASQRIAEGKYEERVPMPSQPGHEDELGSLALSFNRMAAQLERTEAMRRQLIGDVSHELRTPLTAIKGSMEGLMDGVLPATDETYQQIHAEADRLNRLVDDLQELSRVEARAYELDVQPVDVAFLVRTVARRLAPQAESKRISLDLELAPDLPRVLADEDRALQVLTNLTGNALQYTPENGKVTISAKRMNHEVQVSIHDTGIGIPPEHLSHIFDRFYRVDKSRSRRAGGGSGIGLTIARALIEAHGGRIWAKSAGEGQGSTFNFTLKKAA